MLVTAGLLPGPLGLHREHQLYTQLVLLQVLVQHVRLVSDILVTEEGVIVHHGLLLLLPCLLVQGELVSGDGIPQVL